MRRIPLLNRPEVFRNPTTPYAHGNDHVNLFVSNKRLLNKLLSLLRINKEFTIDYENGTKVIVYYKPTLISQIIMSDDVDECMCQVTYDFYQIIKEDE